MSSKEGYDVLRLIEHGQSCYISSEYVKAVSYTHLDVYKRQEKN